MTQIKRRERGTQWGSESAIFAGLWWKKVAAVASFNLELFSFP